MEGDLYPVQKIKVLDGIGITGWVQVEDDWKFISVGNERLLSTHGGKVKMSAAQTQKFDEFMKRNSSSSIIVVVVEDMLELALALAGICRYMSICICDDKCIC